MFFLRKPEIRCTFGKNPYRIDQLYGCRISEQQIPEDQELKFTGQHESGKTNMDVLFVEFSSCTVTKVPQGLEKLFPNLELLEIYNSKLMNICKNDLVEYKNLKKFRCEYNEVKYLPGDLFDDFKNLEFISFNNNKLKIIEPSILDGLVKLKYVDFRVNPNYGLFFSIYPENKPNANFEQIKIDLMEKFFIKFKLFQDLKNSEESLRRENQHLKNLNAILDDRNVLLKRSNEELQSELEQEKTKHPKLTSLIQNTVLTDLQIYIQDETTKDFQIQIEDQKFPVHKFLLAARSSTLAELLKNNPEVENLNLVDISVEIFGIILKFLYTDELPGDDGINFLHLFAAAGKLKIQDLINFAAMKLIDQVDAVNAFDILKLSNKYEHDELKEEAFKEIKKKYPNIVFKDEWAADTEKLEKVIEIIQQREEADRKMNEELKKLTN